VFGESRFEHEIHAQVETRGHRTPVPTPYKPGFVRRPYASNTTSASVANPSNTASVVNALNTRWSG
jgi:hypothetical protein